MNLRLVLPALGASSFVDAFVLPATKASLDPQARTNVPAPLTFKGVEVSGCIVLHEDNDCAAFLNQKALRDAIAGNEALSKMDGATTEMVVLEREKVTLGSLEVPFDRGDASDGADVVTSGGVDVGEFGVLKDEPRCAGAVASTEGTSLWKREASSFDGSPGSSLMEEFEVNNPHYDKEYVKFLEKKALRNTISGNESTAEIIMFESETLTLGSREVIFEQGDESDAVYLVKSGEVEIAREDGDVVASLGEGDIFGELGVLNDEPRYVGPTSSAEGASLWKLKSSSFDRSPKSSLMKEVAKKPQYEGYMAERSLKESVRQCPIFKNFSPEDLQRCIDTFERMQFTDDEMVFRQGDDGDAMYFVKSGTFQAETDEGEIVAFLGEGEYFGELALVFSQPRALSIRAIGDCVAWKISEEQFNKAVQDYTLSEMALSRLKEKYEEDTLINTLRRSKGELSNLLHRASRPKTRKSSVHSTISVCTTFAAVMVLLTMLAPGFDDLGYPQLFRYNHSLSTDLYIEVQMVVVLQMLTSIMGVFRLPKNSPRIRTVGMTGSAAIVLQLGVASISNLNGTDIYLFDAYSLPFKIFCFVINAYAIKTSFELVDVCVGDVNTKGWYSVPAAGNRFTAAATSIFFASLVVLQLKVSLPLLGTKEEASALASAYASTYGGSLMVNSMATNVFIGVGAFLGIMQFEKKITQAKSTALFVVLAMILMGDGLKFVSLLNASPECFPNTEYFTEFLPQLESTYHVYESGLGLLGLVVVNALRRLMSERLKVTGDPN